ncbi:RNA polymerase II-associated [Hysterangium stoloniferum]|nr:RNA polymerase II-associated [Hysterangium stoloniferum]
MSGFKKSKLDLLVRVRYNNPLPSPPFPPKLVKIPTNPSRYARPEFTAELAYEAPLPMVIDAECGMPLDLGKWECLWEENADKSALNPSSLNKPELDPEDQFLVSDNFAMPGQLSNGQLPGTPSMNSPGPSTAHVPWLRKTEYISREGMHKSQSSQEAKAANDVVIDVSRAAQIRDIEASFPPVDEPFDLTSLKHPNKPGVTAVESYEILPDSEIWANAYDLFKFSERPGERAVDAEDPRLDCAILRPMESDGDHFLAYYLTKDDAPAELFKDSRFLDDTRNPVTPFHWVRDYETVKIEQDVPNEFLLVLDDGDLPPTHTTNGGVLERRAKGAYYKNIERKITLKKRRVNKNETVAYTDKWDVINLSHAPLSAEEADERDEALAEVMDTMFLFSRGDADAEGDGDGDAEGEIQVDEVRSTAPNGYGAHHDAHGHFPVDATIEVAT